MKGLECPGYFFYVKNTNVKRFGIKGLIVREHLFTEIDGQYKSQFCFILVTKLDNPPFHNSNRRLRIIIYADSLCFKMARISTLVVSVGDYEDATVHSPVHSPKCC
jgi:hypothetical protein